MELIPAESKHATDIWTILQDAILKRKLEGSQQWQDGYPNPIVIEADIFQGYAHVFLDNGIIIGYVALIPNYEPAYETLVGNWLNAHGNFLVIHRLALKKEYAQQGMGKRLFVLIEEIAKKQHFKSIKLDTSSDNQAMLHLLQHFHYHQCGHVTIRGNTRIAFEKLL